MAFYLSKCHYCSPIGYYDLQDMFCILPRPDDSVGRGFCQPTAFVNMGKKKKKKRKDKKSSRPEFFPLPLKNWAEDKPAPHLHIVPQENTPALSEPAELPEIKIRKKSWGGREFLNLAVGIVVLALMGLMVYQTGKSLKLTRWAIQRNDSIFIYQTTPYLQVQNLRRSNDTVYYSIVNLGLYPAKIKEGRFGYAPLDLNAFGLDKNNPTNYSVLSAAINPDGTLGQSRTRTYSDTTVINAYVIKENPVNRTKVRYDEATVLNYLPKSWEDCFFGQIVYQNEVTRQMRVYFFNVRLPKTPTQNFEFISNENKDIANW